MKPRRWMANRASSPQRGARTLHDAPVHSRRDPRVPVGKSELGRRAPSSSAPSPPPSGEWLRTDKNKLLAPNGSPFHGRGANIQDTRSCNACAYEAPHPQEVIRRVDELVDHWKANFLRLTLESYGASDGRRSWQSATVDDAYLRDLVTIVRHIEQKPGVYVELSVWHDPSLDEYGWPTEATARPLQKLARTFATSPRVLFGVANEPEWNGDGALDAGRLAVHEPHRRGDPYGRGERASPHRGRPGDRHVEPTSRVLRPPPDHGRGWPRRRVREPHLRRPRRHRRPPRRSGADSADHHRRVRPGRGTRTSRT